MDEIDVLHRATLDALRLVTAWRHWAYGTDGSMEYVEEYAGMLGEPPPTSTPEKLVPALVCLVDMVLREATGDRHDRADEVIAKVALEVALKMAGEETS